MAKVGNPPPAGLNLAAAPADIFARKGGPGRPAGPNPYLAHFEASYKGAVDGYGKALMFTCTYGEFVNSTSRLRDAATAAGVSIQTRFLPDDVAAYDAAEKDVTTAEKTLATTDSDVNTDAFMDSLKASVKAARTVRAALTGRSAYRTVPLVKRAPRKAKGGDTIKPEGSAWN